ncbi:MAG: hypothetical protein GX427_01670 [Actinomycetales bacterium]|nr:hypothetical protein [Actinomycetales bacterium]
MTTPSTPAAAPVTPGRIEWRYDIPLLTSRFMLWDFLRVTLLSAALMYVIVIVAGLVFGQELILLPWQVPAIIVGVLLGLFVLASLLLGNRQGARFAVDAKGVEYHAEKRESRMNRIVATVGALMGSPTTAGAGALAMSREHLRLEWEGIREVRYYPAARVIAIRNSWRTMLRLHCPPELYDDVAATVRHHHAATPPAA